MKIGIIISSNDAETCWNAVRFANFCLGQNDEAKIYLIGKGVECEKIGTDKYPIAEELQKFFQRDGKIFACGTCIKSRSQKESDLCPINTMKEMHVIVKESDRVVTF